MLSNNGKLQNLFISKQAHAIMGKVWGGAESVKYYFSLKNTNDALAMENHELRQRLSALEHAGEMAKLDSIAGGFSDIGQFHYMPATIVKISSNSMHNYLILGQGSEDGVQPRSGIITPNGVVGIVDAVGKHYSYAMSFMNPGISVSARLGREGAVGPLEWDGRSSGSAVLKEIPLQNRIEKGDTVYTSGYSAIFPAGIPLGTTGQAKVVNGATYEIEVELFQDFKSARYVTLVNNIGKEEIETLEEEESL